MKNILLKRYGNKDRIVQAHLDFLECLKPIHSSTPESLNEVYIQCNKRLEALRALGENVDAYGRVLAPKILKSVPIGYRYTMDHLFTTRKYIGWRYQQSNVIF